MSGVVDVWSERGGVYVLCVSHPVRVSVVFSVSKCESDMEIRRRYCCFTNYIFIAGT